MDVSTLWMLLQTGVGQAAAEASTTAGAITGQDLRVVAACASAAFAIGVGVFAAALSEGLAATKACEGVARNPEAAGLITRTLLVGQAVTESNSIYALVIALLIIFTLAR